MPTALLSRRRRPRPYSNLSPPVNPWWARLVNYGLTAVVGLVMVLVLFFGMGAWVALG
jgi:predicted CDP-diglyceride synthetase/phosphatidate cytidylyltransferase